MSRRSGRSLTFKDAVRLLDDGSPFVRDLDQLIEHAFDAVPVAGPLLGLPYFAFRRKLVAYGEQVVSSIRDRLDGVGRYDRTQRLYAAHAVIVMTAFAEALGELLGEADLRVERTTEAPVLSDEHGRLVLRFRDGAVPDPVPGPDSSRRVDEVAALYDVLAAHARQLLHTWGLDDSGADGAMFTETLPARAMRRYEEHYRRLVVEAPEFAVWAYLSEHEATRAELGELGVELRTRLDSLATGLAGVPEVLAEVAGQAGANRVREDLAHSYQAVLTRSVLGDTRAPEGFALPTLEYGYVNPAVRLVQINAYSRPSEDGWWEDQPSYDDMQALIVGALTTPDAVDRPLVILGQPGAGKSVLTKMLAARLADRGFLPVRVELRNVPADADIQTQIEDAIRATIGRSIEWPDLAESARDDGLLPLIILDGFDELLQATGVNRTDYLELVTRFQRRERELGRPAAAIVTSRTVVADRARFPDGCSALRIEPFDEARVATWLGIWNEANHTSLDGRSILRYGELAEQPLLLTLLALYDAETGELRTAGPELSRAELYDRLLTEFARREVRKPGTNVDEEQERRAVADELHRLELVALAMFNRHAKSVTAAELDYDLAGERPPVRDDPGLAKPLTAAQLTLGRFFFVHESSAQRAGEIEHAYEFLHATLGEFLVARHVVETLQELAGDRAYFRSKGRPSELDDGELWKSLSFAALTGSAASVEFTEGLLRRLPGNERAAVRDLAIELLAEAQYANLRRSRTDYEPERQPVFVRHSYYSANLVVLAVLSTGDPLDFHPSDMRTWPQALTPEEFSGLRETVRVLAIPGEDTDELRIVREDGSEVDPYVSSVRRRIRTNSLAPSDQLFTDAAIRPNSEAGRLIRESPFKGDLNAGLAAMQPYFEFIGDGISSGHDDGGMFVPAARVLLELRLASFASTGRHRRCRLYKWCLDNGGPWSVQPWLDTVLRQLREDVRELGPSSTAELLRYALDQHFSADAPESFRLVAEEIRGHIEETSDDRLLELLDDTGDPQR